MSPRFSLSLLAAQSDERLAELVADGHERAFEALAHRYRRRLLRYCRRVGLSHAGAEDVVQQALLQAWLALASGREVRHVKAWLYRIAHNAAVNSRRGTAAGHGQLGDGAGAAAALGSQTDLDGVVAARSALGEVAALPAMQRRAIVLTALEGRTHEEVAGTLGVSIGAVRGLVYRARESLRSAVAALTPQPLLAWAVGAADGGVPAGQRLAQLAGSGGAGQTITALVFKAGAAAVTAGVLAASTGVMQPSPAGPSRAASGDRAASAGADATRPLERASGRQVRRDPSASSLDRHGRGRRERRTRGMRVRGIPPTAGERSRLRDDGGRGGDRAGPGGDGRADDRLAAPTSPRTSVTGSPGSDSNSGPGSVGGSSGQQTSTPSNLSSTGSGDGGVGPSGSDPGSGDGASGLTEASVPSDGGGTSGSSGDGYALSG